MLQKGITLIEMMVAVGIFSIISAVVLFNYANFNSNLLVTNLAYEIALSIRQAQVYGLSVKQQVGESDSTKYAYGVYFSVDAGNTEREDSFTLYADAVSNNRYDGEGYTGECTGTESADGDICMNRLTMRGNTRIINYCVSGGGTSCSTKDEGGVSILFQRPNPVAFIYEDGEDEPNNRVEITIGAGNTEKQKKVVVERTGQISVQDVE
jgi:prepilin-type N-terminal cleavage/methylation domain-containing protein